MTCDDIKAGLVSTAVAAKFDAASSKRSADDHHVIGGMGTADAGLERENDLGDRAVRSGRFFIGHVAPMKQRIGHLITARTC